LAFRSDAFCSFRATVIPQLVDRVHEDAEVVAEALEEHLVDLRR
jgi:hypothetical protein